MKQGDSMGSESEATKIFFKSSEGVCSLLDDQGNRTYLKAGHALLAEVKTEGSTPIEICMTDRLGSVLGMHVSAASIPYMPYGFSAPNFLERKTLGFSGELHDAAARCYLLGVGYHRPYSPALMRFIRSDDASPFGAGGINAYAYCGGDPINNIDPSGHSFVKFFKNLLTDRPKRKANEYKSYVSSQLEKLEAVKVYELQGEGIHKAEQGYNQHLRLTNALKEITISKKLSKAAQRHMDKHGLDATDKLESFNRRRIWLETKKSKMESYAIEYRKYIKAAAKENSESRQPHLNAANTQVRQDTSNIQKPKGHFQWEQP
ncbi:RHS repeat-associated core domain-containing protein [Pseudomonas sp. MLB6B]